MTASRHSLVSSALRLSYLTIGWNGVVGAIALVLAVAAGSLALAGFALNALLDSTASVVLVWRFAHERRDPLAVARVEQHAQRFILAAMFGVAGYLGFDAVRALLDSSHAEASLLGVTLAAVSLVVLPWLGRQKMRVAAALESGALRGDGVLTIAAAALAAVTLVALVTTSALDWWWADPVAALLIAAALAVEATRVAVRHRFG